MKRQNLKTHWNIEKNIEKMPSTKLSKIKRKLDTKKSVLKRYVISVVYIAMDTGQSPHL